MMIFSMAIEHHSSVGTLQEDAFMLHIFVVYLGLLTFCDEGPNGITYKVGYCSCLLTQG